MVPTVEYIEWIRGRPDAVAEAALERDLLVVPGCFFENDDRLRVSLGRDPERMRAALDVLGETLDALAGATV